MPWRAARGATIPCSAVPGFEGGYLQPEETTAPWAMPGRSAPLQKLWASPDQAVAEVAR
jgi:hypothetical protein